MWTSILLSILFIISMINIYTSYYAVCNKLPNNLAKIQISVYSPPGIEGLIPMKALSPSEDLLRRAKGGQVSNEEYKTEYLNNFVSKGLTPESLYNGLLRFAKSHGYEGLVLLCYESPDKFCHRHVLAEWLNEIANPKIEEFLWK